MTWNSLFRRSRSDCPHVDVEVSHAAGLERSVCRVCGTVTIHYQEAGVREVDRAGLARPADVAHAAAASGA